MIRVEPGYYRHFKRGDLYIVHRVVRNATNGGVYAAMVYYEAINKTKDFDANAGGIESEPGHFVRAVEEFTEIVEWPDGVRRSRWVKESLHEVGS